MPTKSKTTKHKTSAHQNLSQRLKRYCLNRKLLTITISALVLISTIFTIWQVALPHPFRLNDASYGGSSQIDIDKTEYEQLIQERSSFIVFIDQPNCITANKLREMLNNIADEYQIHIYHTMWSDIQGTNLRENIKYYPSIAIIKQGQIITALDANSDAHVAYYNSETDLKDWLSRYVKLQL